MRTRRTAAAVLAVLALTAVAACGKDGSPNDDSAGSSTSYEVKKDVSISGSATFDAAKKRGKLIVGAKADQPNLGFEDVTSGTRSGFDIEIAKMVAADLGFSPDKIEFKTIPSTNRETAISGGEVDYYVGTYTINDERKKSISFAGPYYVAGQDLLVGQDNSDITGPESTKGKKVCSASGSTSIDRIKTYGAEIVAFDTYSQCVDKLLDKSVDAVTTDDAILKGYGAKYEGKLKVVGKPFSEEPYGVGLNKDDKALRDAINNALEAHEKNGDWKKAYDATLGKSGADATPPQLARY
ncbi:glutamate ABC transporter substrate-binding protein [Peterkaempfera bronchialis]|uniref:Glutamate ABC transporter substrate-binding protein n=1 Tax=Peterkaempfera bronchialis TaxID=2126346 RepID=A0A345T171_9ACTN|nr:glutamate ABC transporter substrate-binding protein [Peterkaempfera bronchialis]AXI79726.1 glutamate ABC transporter substrate-binding protein [Peterkaempfera bronchialis]